MGHFAAREREVTDDAVASCPANATGQPDCQCDKGYNGTLSFANGDWSGQCTSKSANLRERERETFGNDAVVPCPADATGEPDCQCDTGYNSTLKFANGTWTGQCTCKYTWIH